MLVFTVILNQLSAVWKRAEVGLGKLQEVLEGIIGWEAGTRTPIRRSRVLLLAMQAKKINNLTLAKYATPAQRRDQALKKRSCRQPDPGLPHRPLGL